MIGAATDAGMARSVSKRLSARVAFAFTIRYVTGARWRVMPSQVLFPALLTNH